MYKVIRIVSLEINPVKTSQQITVGSFFIVTTFSIYLTIRGGVHILGPLIDLVWKCTRIQVHMVMVGVHHRNLSSSIQQRKSCFACDSQFQCSCVAMLHASAIGTLEIDQRPNSHSKHLKITRQISDFFEEAFRWGKVAVQVHSREGGCSGLNPAKPPKIGLGFQKIIPTLPIWILIATGAWIVP